LIYVSAIAGVVHYYWLVKSDVRKPLLYGAIVLLLLGERVVVAVRKSGVNLKGWTLKKPGGGNTASVSKPRASSSVR
jgi:sulfoxide reductase heme-binding subunit YedZ